jgi:hypothetical protein
VKEACDAVSRNASLLPSNFGGKEEYSRFAQLPPMALTALIQT